MDLENNLLSDEDIADNEKEAAVKIVGWERVTDEFDPNRCQGVNGGASGGQCLFKAITPSKFCSRHGGSNHVRAEKAEKVRNYNLGKWRARIHQFADSPEVKSLREEIGIVRLMIEEIINKCEDTNDLIIYSNRLQDLIQQAEKLVVSCHKLEQSTGVLLDKASILVVCDSMVKIIGEHVEDSEALEVIAAKFIETVAKMGGLQNVTANVPAIAGAN